MLWPNGIDYTQAIGFFPDISMLDPTLKGGNPQRGRSRRGKAIGGIPGTAQLPPGRTHHRVQRRPGETGTVTGEGNTR